MAVAAIVAATLLAPMARPAAHEGHDHGPPQAATSGAAAPRIAVHSESYVVGILKGDQLVIYLDRFASNEPVTAATVAVTIGDAADAVNAQAKTDGTYVLTSPRLRTAGPVELIFAITGESGDDLLIGTLLVPQAAGGAPAPGSSTSEPWRAWLANSLSQTQRMIALALATFGFGASGAYLLRKGRFLPGAATTLAAIGTLAFLVGTARGHEDHDHAKNRPAASLPVSSPGAGESTIVGLSAPAAGRQRVHPEAQPTPARSPHHVRAGTRAGPSSSSAASSPTRTAAASCRASTAAG